MRTPQANGIIHIVRQRYPCGSVCGIAYIGACCNAARSRSSNMRPTPRCRPSFATTKADLGAPFVDEECVRDAERPTLRLRKQPNHVGVRFHILIDGSVVKVIGKKRASPRESVAKRVMSLWRDSPDSATERPPFVFGCDSWYSDDANDRGLERVIELGNRSRAATATSGPCPHLRRRPTDQQQMPIRRANDLASDVCLVVHSPIVDRESANWLAACAAVQCPVRTVFIVRTCRVSRRARRPMRAASASKITSALPFGPQSEFGGLD